MKQLFVVEIVREVLVVAETVSDAETLARDVNDCGTADVRASAMRYFPGDWDEKCIPWGNDDEELERTVGEWIAMGGAPRLHER